MHENPADDASSPSRHGLSLDGVTDLDAAVRAVRERPGPVEVLVGPGQLAGRHLGALPRRQLGEALRGAGADPLILRAEVAVDEDVPDEGIIAVLDDHLALAAGLGADHLVVPRAGRSPRGRSEERLYSMLAALAEAASAHGVHLLLENEGSTADELDLLTGLERARAEGELEVDEDHVSSIAWNVSSAAAAGEDPVTTFPLLQPLLERAPVLVRGVDERTLAALLEDVPGLREAVSAGRVLVVVDHS